MSEMNAGCGREDCTVAETGVCLLNNDPMECPERLLETEQGDGPTGVERDWVEFPGSGTLALTQVRELMGQRCVRLVGILGEPNSGKTACLVSLYLLLARNRLDKFRFADSRTLMGFEQISQGARRWNAGAMPEELTSHTELRDERTAGFLHARLASPESSDTFDLLLPDLPGEWTGSLVERNRNDRLRFLARADVLWIVVSGEDLRAVETRQVCIHRTSLLIDRLGAFLEDRPPMVLVVTRADQGMPDQGAVVALREKGVEQGFDTDVVSIASFSENDNVEPGSGISELVRKSTGSASENYELWPHLGLEATFMPPVVGLVRGAD